MADRVEVSEARMQEALEIAERHSRAWKLVSWGALSPMGKKVVRVLLSSSARIEELERELRQARAQMGEADIRLQGVEAERDHYRVGYAALQAEVERLRAEREEARAQLAAGLEADRIWSEEFDRDGDPQAATIRALRSKLSAAEEALRKVAERRGGHWEEGNRGASISPTSWLPLPAPPREEPERETQEEPGYDLHPDGRGMYCDCAKPSRHVPEPSAVRAEEPPRCATCAKPATCLGRDEGATALTYGCDDCCGHGCIGEKPPCSPVHAVSVYEDKGWPQYQDALQGAFTWVAEQVLPEPGKARILAVCSSKRAADAVAAAFSRPASTQEQGWRPIESAPKMRKVIVFYRNSLGKGRRVMACYYTEKALEMHDDYSDVGEWDEESGTSYAPAGWYEEHDSDNPMMPLQAEPTHWMPLPAEPKEE